MGNIFFGNLKHATYSTYQKSHSYSIFPSRYKILINEEYKKTRIIFYCGRGLCNMRLYGILKENTMQDATIEKTHTRLSLAQSDLLPNAILRKAFGKGCGCARLHKTIVAVKCV